VSDEGDGDGTTPPAKKENAIEAWALKTAGTIIGGLGTAGAMVVIGSAVLWIRFKEAGIPPVQAVSVQPRQEALVQGAQTTVFFVLIAFAVVAALYIIDLRKEEDPAPPVAADDEDKTKTDTDKKKKGTKPEPPATIDGGTTRPIQTRTKIAICGLPIVAIGWLCVATGVGFCAWLILSAMTVLLTGACLWIGHRSDKNFWALAAAVFVSILVFAGASTYAITQEQKFVQAVAILRGADDIGLTGYFVAATDSRIYFANSIGIEGTTAPERKPLQSVKVGDDVTYSIGPLEKQKDATLRAEAMKKRLISDREAGAGGGSKNTAADLPGWVSSEVAAAFGGSIEAHTETTKPLCLMRFFSSDGGAAKGQWWMSCEEAEALASVDDVRARFALPRRFQANYDRRANVEVAAKTKLSYVEGSTAPQCGGAGQEACGHRYPGGGTQYWIATPEQLGKVTLECTTAEPDKNSAWRPCTS
jgi:hypothetical protein